MIFLRPWFLILIFLIPLFYKLHKKAYTKNPWKKIINPEFLPFLLVDKTTSANKNHIFIFISILWTLLVFALAGPAFEKAPVFTATNSQATVIIADLNSLNKNTLAQLKIKLSETVKQLKEEQIALVLYDQKGYIALPLTKDTQIIQELIPVLNPSVLPGIGNNPKEGFKTAINLLKNNNLDKGRILFFTGGTSSIDDILPLIEQNDYSIGVLGLSAGEKTPILGKDGNFKRDSNGNILLTNLNKDELSKLGVFELWQPDKNDIQSLIQKTNNINEKSLFNQSQTAFLTVDTHKDLGIYLLLILMPFIALLYRKGFFIFLICFIVTSNGYASFWLRDDQILYNTNKKAINDYHNKDYLSALAGFKNDSSVTGLYNQANATAHMGKYQEAIELYKEALKINPEHKEAAFNKAYLEQLMKNEQNNLADQNNDKNSKDNKEEQNQQSATDSSNQDEDSNQKNESASPDDEKKEDNNTSSNKNNESQSSQNDEQNNNELNSSTNPEQNNQGQQEASPQTNENTFDENEQVYPQKEEKDNKPQQSKKESDDLDEKNSKNNIFEQSNNKENSPLDQTTQEIFNRLKKDPSLLLRYRLNEQYRRNP